MELKQDWHSLDTNEVFKKLDSSDRGLSQEEVKKRQEKFGPNKLPEQKTDGYLKIFLRQFKSPLIYILLLAVVVMIFLAEYIDAGVIFAVLFLNAIIGAFQEGKAQNTLLALKKLSSLEAVVVREGREEVIPAEELVPGDVIILNDGDQIPIDGRVLQSVNLLINESALTGESIPVEKKSEKIEGDKNSLGDQNNRIFKGTYVVRGHGRAIVTAIGLQTEIGKISKELTTLDSEMPLKANIKHLTNIIMIAVGVAVGVIFSVGVLYGRSVTEMFLVGVAAAVSVIPEGLPIVITLVLATGVWRMSKRNALVKKLQAVEALGQATVIAVDKTGTITKNELMVNHIFIGGNEYEVTGTGYDRNGEIKKNDKHINSLGHSDIVLMGRIATYCASARTTYSEEKDTWKVTGDPTEAALLVFGEKVGFMKREVEAEEATIGEIPFDAELKYHAVVHKTKEGNFLTMVGAPEVIIERVDKVWSGGEEKNITEAEREKLKEEVVRLSARGLRVIAAAYSKDSPEEVSDENLPPLTFAGFFGMTDVVRTEVKKSIEDARRAGIKVVMITGDHRATAQAIASQVGIFRAGDKVVEGYELSAVSEDNLASLVEGATVFARVSPKHKLEIIQAFKKRGDIIAMTGDGVNDALSLVAADLGISMGKIGTEVAKEAGDLILLDDNFSSIIAAVEEGRNIYKTIKKVVLYLLSTGIGEMFTIGGAILLGWPIPLLATQIIWLNFVTDGFLVVSFAMEPKVDIEKTEAKKRGIKLLDKLNILRMILMGGVMTLGALFVFGQYVPVEAIVNGGIESPELVKAWTMTLTVLAVFQWFNIWNCRSKTKSIFTSNIFSNLYLLASTVIVIVLHIAILYIPFLQEIFHTTSLSIGEWGLVILVSSSIIVVEELRKLIFKIFKISIPKN